MTTLSVYTYFENSEYNYIPTYFTKTNSNIQKLEIFFKIRS